ncbi:uncharacterized protein [Haliotis asinina]|uniref:uncharacterized protein n=1 Tax=Haliotis asinina TaxID=109174 RepID=UPI0035327969
MNSIGLFVGLLLWISAGCNASINSSNTPPIPEAIIQHWSIYNRPAYRSAFAKYIPIYNGTGGNTADAEKRPNCKEMRRNFTTEAGNLCPAYFRLDVDDTRLPRVIYQAECSCRNCMYARRLSGNKRRTKKKFRCEKVYSYDFVLRQRCKVNSCGYQLFLEPVAVACSCNMVKS